MDNKNTNINSKYFIVKKDVSFIEAVEWMEKGFPASARGTVMHASGDFIYYVNSWERCNFSLNSFKEKWDLVNEELTDREQAIVREFATALMQYKHLDTQTGLNSVLSDWGMDPLKGEEDKG